MRKLMATAVLILLSCVAFAQPPKILQIGREEVKPGKGAAHDKYEASWMQAALKAKNTRPVIGMVSVNNNEEWWLSGFDSFADMEKDHSNPAFSAVDAQFSAGDGEYINSSHAITALYRADLSFGVDAPLGAARGFSVRTVRVRPGHNSEYEEIRKIVKQAVESGNVKDVHSAAYQVVAGAPNGTFLLFTAFKSLAERDTPNEAMAAAMRDVGSKISDLQSKSIISSEDQIFMINPKISNPPPDMLAAAPDFWHPKATMAKAAPAKAGADKSKAKAGQ